MILLDHLVVSSVSNDSDYYGVSVNPGSTLVVATSTPADGPGEFVNNLNPKIELYNPSGTLVASGTVGPDGRNESIRYFAASGGVYRVHVAAENGTQGEFYLSSYQENRRRYWILRLLRS